jgi:cell wall-associated NlpC family hydrolase
MRRGGRTAGLRLLIACIVTIVIAFGGMSPPAIPTSAPADELTDAQNSLVTLEANAEQAQQRYAAELAQEHATQQAATASELQSKLAATAADHAHAQLGLLVAAAYRTGPDASLKSLTVTLNGDEVLAHAHANAANTANPANVQANPTQQPANANIAVLSAVKGVIPQFTAEATDAVATATRYVGALSKRFDKLRRRKPATTQPTTPPHPHAPNAASRALDFALAQIGKPYLWGATGPNSFDCSGLTMRAYEAAGVTLPHFAAFQYAASHHLSLNDLQPGDLLFWSTNPRKPATIYHEALYLGGGLMVQAPKSHWRISVASMWMWGPIQFFARPY